MLGHNSALRIQDAAYLLRQARPEMLIQGILARQGVAVIAAPPYKGKTFLALEAMRAVAEGAPFLGHFKVTRPGNVLYLGNDSPGWDLAAQFDKLIGLPDPKLEDVTRLLNETALGSYRFIFDTSFTLDHDGNADLLIDAARRAWSSRGYDYFHTESEVIEQEREVRGTDLIVIDTLRSVHGAEENDNTAMQRIMNRLRYIAHETKAAVLALHHFNKGSKESPEASLERLRGASAIGGAVDSIYALTGKHPSIAVRVLKNRPAPEQGDFMYEIIEKTDAQGYQSVKLAVSSGDGVVNLDVRKAVLGHLNKNLGRFVKTSELIGVVQHLFPGHKQHAIDQQLNRTLRSLEKAGTVARVHGAARIASTQEEV